MTLRDALRKALTIVREQRRGVLLATSQCQYRLAPSEQPSRSYLLSRSVRYNNEWQPWSTVDGFDADDVLTDKWSIH